MSVGPDEIGFRIRLDIVISVHLDQTLQGLSLPPLGFPKEEPSVLEEAPVLAPPGS